jgi:hypothetical protein
MNASASQARPELCPSSVRVLDRIGLKRPRNEPQMLLIFRIVFLSDAPHLGLSISAARRGGSSPTSRSKGVLAEGPPRQRRTMSSLRRPVLSMKIQKAAPVQDRLEARGDDPPRSDPFQSEVAARCNIRAGNGVSGRRHPLPADAHCCRPCPTADIICNWHTNSASCSRHCWYGSPFM